MLFVWIILAIAWIAASYYISYIASLKGRNPAAFLVLSLLVSPLIVGIVVAAIPANLYVDKTPRRRCPECDEFISVNAKVCKHCSSSVKPLTVAEIEESVRKCPACSSSYSAESKFCKNCGQAVAGAY